MKTNRKRSILLGLIVSMTALLSFSGERGGDSMQVYYDGQLVLEQFVHADKSVKNIRLAPSTGNEKLDVYYYHCGAVGKSRYLTIMDESDRPMHVWEFPDATKAQAAMRFTVKQAASVLKSNDSRFTISYSSKELPKGKRIATIELDNKAFAIK